MPSLKKITSDIKKRNNELDGLTDDLVNALGIYQKEYEILLLNTPFSLYRNGNLKSITSNYNKAQKLNPMKQLAFNDIATGWIGEYPTVAKGEIKFMSKLGVTTDLTFTDVTALRVYQNVDLGAMLAMGRGMDALIKRELVNSIALEANYKTTVTNIAIAYLGRGAKLGQAANWADAVMRTSMFGLTRTIDKQIYDDMGETEFIYVGALDKRTRAFCRRHVGNEYTTEQIEQFGSQNGSGLPGFFSPGGYRCRHSMIGTSLFE